MSSILVLNGPNLNLLGTREPHIYGSKGLDDIEAEMKEKAQKAGVLINFLQSNAEHILIERIHDARNDGTKFIIINPGPYTHTSIAIRDALAGVAVPFIEIHISNIHAREDFRHRSYLSDIACGTIVGLGTDGYQYALDYALSKIQR